MKVSGARYLDRCLSFKLLPYFSLLLIKANNNRHIDNWLLERCTDTAEECTTNSSPSNSDTSRNSNAAGGVRVKLIDFGRSLSVTHSSHTTGTIDKSSANKGTRHTNLSAQLAALATLYQPVVADAATAETHMNNLGKPEVVYKGDISAKGYKCTEMEQRQPWSYQVGNLLTVHTPIIVYVCINICKALLLSDSPGPPHKYHTLVKFSLHSFVFLLYFFSDGPARLVQLHAPTAPLNAAKTSFGGFRSVSAERASYRHYCRSYHSAYCLSEWY